ncbi:hypothetical protein PT160_07705 [Erysipelothrix rhusiopathiae]|nr:hypothetical protein [Erysipelothrix rhusiopathiae]MDE8269049.1 hypothetical protein [Erysipelothrix rhusiopathiae]MDE8270682.1 hypothetical protein [Erysipelothrix rhusiopathiae]MDE8279107.1 hypothetical protein [Erysipelothrix rhusiopathiae]MDE8319407.1 hypothetical protein [Erysipelothrix rhusiopathiae]
MLYYQVKEIHNQIEVLCSTKIELEKNDVVVIPDYSNEPVTARVQRTVPPYKALVSPIEPIEIIDKVEVKSWESALKKRTENKIIFEKMQSKINEIKTIEQLEKFAGKDDEMAELLRQYRNENKKSDTHSDTNYRTDETEY